MSDLNVTTLPKMVGRDGQKSRRPKPKKKAAKKRKR
jgi:hypothetical protein